MFPFGDSGKESISYLSPSFWWLLTILGVPWFGAVWLQSVLILWAQGTCLVPSHCQNALSLKVSMSLGCRNHDILLWVPGASGSAWVTPNKQILVDKKNLCWLFLGMQVQPHQVHTWPGSSLLEAKLNLHEATNPISIQSVAGIAAPPLESQLCSPLLHSAFSDITVAAWNQHGGSICNVEIGTLYKSGLPAPRELVVKHVAAHHRYVAKSSGQSSVPILPDFWAWWHSLSVSLLEAVSSLSSQKSTLLHLLCSLLLFSLISKHGEPPDFNLEPPLFPSGPTLIPTLNPQWSLSASRL